MLIHTQVEKPAGADGDGSLTAAGTELMRARVIAVCRQPTFRVIASVTTRSLGTFRVDNCEVRVLPPKEFTYIPAKCVPDSISWLNNQNQANLPPVQCKYIEQVVLFCVADLPPVQSKYTEGAALWRTLLPDIRCGRMPRSFVSGNEETPHPRAGVRVTFTVADGNRGGFRRIGAGADSTYAQVQPAVCSICLLLLPARFRFTN